MSKDNNQGDQGIAGFITNTAADAAMTPLPDEPAGPAPGSEVPEVRGYLSFTISGRLAITDEYTVADATKDLKEVKSTLTDTMGALEFNSAVEQSEELKNITL